MTHVWPFWGDAPVPTLVSSYCRPLGVLVILLSLFLAASGAGVGFGSWANAGAAKSAAAKAVERSRVVVFVMVFDSFLAPEKGRGSLSQPRQRSELPGGASNVDHAARAAQPFHACGVRGD